MTTDTPSIADAADAGIRLRATLREVREELVRIDAALERYATAGEAERTPLWTDLRPVVAAETDGIDQKLARVRELIERHTPVAKLHSDRVSRIENLWGDAKRAWQSAPGSLVVLRRAIDASVLEIGYLTVPERTNDNLDSLRVGGTMNFHEEFAEEIPSKDARTLILKWLNAHPRTVTGVVDVPSGTIIRASRKPVRRMASWALVLGVVALALVSAVYAPRLVSAFGFAGPPGATGTRYLWAVLIAYGGAVLHIAIAALKQLRRAAAGEDQRFTAIGNFTVWVHINEMYLMAYAFAIPAVAYTVILSTGRIDNLTMVFVGFSIDSLLDVVLARFDKFSAGRTEAIAAAVR